MQTGTKLAIAVLALVTLVVWFSPGLSSAGEELDGYKFWQDHISELKAKYGAKLKCNNCIYVLLRYKPYPEGGLPGESGTPLQAPVSRVLTVT